MTPRIAVIGLVAADLSRAFDFYRRLGLEIPEDAAGQPHVEVPLPGGLRLAFDTVDTVRSLDPDYVHGAGGGASLAFDCGSPEAVDAVHTELLAAGGTSALAPFDAFWGQRYATVTDPDGNHVDLFAALPG
ncbi:VOC family protein [Rhodococcus sp. NPDC058505]|uniref:VOC family protein n=1 Tax=unclassified Rhodococcus (in: high G+C Gram-positive bacteria) TaxID=192944 RepID=UPI003651F9F0